MGDSQQKVLDAVGLGEKEFPKPYRRVTAAKKKEKKDD